MGREREEKMMQEDEENAKNEMDEVTEREERMRT